MSIGSSTLSISVVLLLLAILLCESWSADLTTAFAWSSPGCGLRTRITSDRTKQDEIDSAATRNQLASIVSILLTLGGFICLLVYGFLSGEENGNSTSAVFATLTLLSLVTAVVTLRAAQSSYSAQSALRSCRGVIDSVRSKNMQSAMLDTSNLHLSAGCFALGLVVVAVWFWGYASRSLGMPLFRYLSILLTIVVVLIITLLLVVRFAFMDDDDSDVDQKQRLQKTQERIRRQSGVGKLAEK